MTGLTCPFCNAQKSRVAETRRVEGGIRRLRLCLQCGKSFSTYEEVKKERLYVRKRDGSRQLFDREKLRAGLELAFTKSVVDEAKIDDLTDRVVGKVQGIGSTEIASEQIGNLVLQELISNPNYHVAYVRFASVFIAVTDPQRFTVLVENVRAELAKQSGDKS
jgi:transcriptional repressor NrdR